MAASRQRRHLLESGTTVDAARRHRPAAARANGATDLGVVNAVVETLKAMLLEQAATRREREAQVVKLQERVDSQEAALAWRAAEVEHLKLLIAKL